MSIFDDFDQYVVIVKEKPEMSYGPMNGPDAIDFADKWNAWFAKTSLPETTWIVVPLSKTWSIPA
jgi:hypothetical protein